MLKSSLEILDNHNYYIIKGEKDDKQNKRTGLVRKYGACSAAIALAALASLGAGKAVKADQPAALKYPEPRDYFLHTREGDVIYDEDIKDILRI
ncbi:hypothetical protein KP766_11860 [Streptococcus equi subsp. equi]|uniref:hypothetical protein n=1 Tax=Streptococcus equi TaxID=1336 RepID=UPI001E3DFF76|nr:hypothetical protein [Streptococcus equi]MCD3535237.1 hypothetical protein [Streptococcus equi subsp. equi]